MFLSICLAHVPDAKNASPFPSNSGEVILEWRDGLRTELHHLFMDFLSPSWWWKNRYIPGDNCASQIDLNTAIVKEHVLHEYVSKNWVIGHLNIFVKKCCLIGLRGNIEQQDTM